MATNVVKEKRETSSSTKAKGATLKESILSKLQGEVAAVKRALAQWEKEYSLFETSLLLAISKLQEELANLTCRFEGRFGPPTRNCQVCGKLQIAGDQSPNCGTCGAKDSVI